jgi:3-dehydroquinate dehydratase-2
MIHVINGPNLNLLGKREPEIYGGLAFEEILAQLRAYGQSRGVELSYYQSNHEGELVDYIQTLEANTPVIINAAGYSHTSVAIRDAIAAVGVTAIEVHISNIYAREPFRHMSYLSGVCKGSIAGLGTQGYMLALQYLIDIGLK